MKDSKRAICGLAISLLSFLVACIIIIPDIKTFSQGVIVTILIIIILVLIIINTVLED